MYRYLRTREWQEHFDFLAVGSWCSFGLLLITQLCNIDQDWIPNAWAISIIGLASCLALSDLRRKGAEAKMHLLRAESITDPLTGVGNRRWLDIEMKQRISQLRRQDSPFSVLMLDIDHFKSINDTWGHDAGDSVLKAVANEIRHTLRDMDVLCRIGGEEFISILPGTDVKAAFAAAERIRSAIEKLGICFQDQTIRFTISIGVTAGTRTDEALAIIKRADDAVYAAKRDGRNRSLVKTAHSVNCVDVHSLSFVNKALLDSPTPT
jgi:diguanylate cyclase (GGDEF)-like protein